MAKPRSKKPATEPAGLKTALDTARKSAAAAEVQKSGPPGQATREFIESVVIAIILAFLFRAFEAEAFVIPTGSMAPTLQGNHKDVWCQQCGLRYQAGASSEDVDTRGADITKVVATMCPNCRYTMRLDFAGDPNHTTFSGDRILVSKFAYELGEPQRWDVIVFRYPNNAKQNYIKRLVGLPNETIRIFHGDAYVKGPDDARFRIARKPPDKIKAMLQLVHDNDHRAADLQAVGWPERWSEWPAPQGAPRWTSQREGRAFALAAEPAESEAWLRYRHIVASPENWQDILAGAQPTNLADWRGELISDFYAYNAQISVSPWAFNPQAHLDGVTANGVRYYDVPLEKQGQHWVGDLALEATLDVQSAGGEVLLMLVEAGVQYVARIDVATGQARLRVAAGDAALLDAAGAETPELSAATPIVGPGRRRVRFANVDDALCLWVNERPVVWQDSSQRTVGVQAAYRPPAENLPHYAPDEPGDLAPLGIGGRGVALEVSNLRVLRDVYYIAATGSPNDDYDGNFTAVDIRETLTTPELWSNGLFESRRAVEFVMGPDDFFPLGDNSPESQDARSWGGVGPTVRRELLTGKALLIYWPHPWMTPAPYTPNFTGMKLIR